MREGWSGQPELKCDHIWSFLSLSRHLNHTDLFFFIFTAASWWNANYAWIFTLLWSRIDLVYLHRFTSAFLVFPSAFVCLLCIALIASLVVLIAAILHPCLLFLTQMTPVASQFSRLACLSQCSSVYWIISFQCLWPFSPIHFSFCIAPVWNLVSIPGLLLVQTLDSSGDGSEVVNSTDTCILHKFKTKSYHLIVYIALVVIQLIIYLPMLL